MYNLQACFPPQVIRREPNRLVNGITVRQRCMNKENSSGPKCDKNRIIQAHLDYLEDLQPAQSDSQEALNSTCVECHRQIQALRGNTNTYGSVLSPKLLHVFPADICRRWLI
jgi:hypothetical protein